MNKSDWVSSFSLCWMVSLGAGSPVLTPRSVYDPVVLLFNFFLFNFLYMVLSLSSPSLYLSLSPSLSISLSIYRSIHVSLAPSLYLSLPPSVYLSLSINLSIYLAISLLVSLSMSLVIARSAFCFVFLFVCLFVSERSPSLPYQKQRFRRQAITH